MDLTAMGAWGGPAWRSRSGDSGFSRVEPVEAYGADTEWSVLRRVSLHTPSRGIADIGDPDAALHVRRLDAAALQEQVGQLAETYAQLGIDVVRTPSWLVDDQRTPNFVFQRDQWFPTPAGMVQARLASEQRAPEEAPVAAHLALAGTPVIASPFGDAMLEGADCLWLSPQRLLCGVGKRTNEPGLRQLRQAMTLLDVEVVPVEVRGPVQHLLGIVQLVSADRAVVRARWAGPRLREALASEGVEVIEVADTDEVVYGQAHNFVTVDRSTVVMAAGCPGFRKLLEAHGVEVAAEVECSEIKAAGGGLACATGILRREPAA